jgi:hypothetical protein
VALVPGSIPVTAPREHGAEQPADEAVADDEHTPAGARPISSTSEPHSPHASTSKEGLRLRQVASCGRLDASRTTAGTRVS